MRVALIIAGGVGTRMRNCIPKQFIKVNDKPIIIYTLEKFEQSEYIDAILVVTLNDWIEYAKQLVIDYNIKKAKWIIPGGNSNQNSIKKGIDFLYEKLNFDKKTLIMIHAANRPNITNQIIKNNIDIFNKYGNANTFTKCYEVSFLNDVNGLKYLERDDIIHTQTPQTYTLGKLIWAHQQASKLNIPDQGSTCALMLKLKEKVFFAEGSKLNFKITVPEDLEFFKALIR